MLKWCVIGEAHLGTQVDRDVSAEVPPPLPSFDMPVPRGKEVACAKTLLATVWRRLGHPCYTGVYGVGYGFSIGYGTHLFNSMLTCRRFEITLAGPISGSDPGVNPWCLHVVVIQCNTVNSYRAVVLDVYYKVGLSILSDPSVYQIVASRRQGDLYVVNELKLFNATDDLNSRTGCD